jgi:hypothetical protein
MTQDQAIQQLTQQYSNNPAIIGIFMCHIELGKTVNEALIETYTAIINTSKSK